MFTKMTALPSHSVVLLEPFSRELTSAGAFSQLSQQHQVVTLADAVTIEHPTLAVALRTLTPVEQSALLARLTRGLRARPSAEAKELRILTRNGRSVRCVAICVGTGIDLRLLDGDDFARTQLCADIGRAQVKADEWWRQLQSAGWSA
jgi:hypothetical protein